MEGSPLRIHGQGDKITFERLHTSTYGGEPMIIHSIAGYISTLHLVQYPEREQCLLLDAGMPSDFYRIQFYVENVLYPKKKIQDVMKVIVSTHCHIDHVGAGYLFGMHGVPVVTTKNWERYYANFRGKIQRECDRFLSLTVAWRLGRRIEPVWTPAAGTLTPAGRAPLPQLDDGSSVPFFDDWVAIKCPGHTGHMVLLYHPTTHILYAADFFILHRKEFRAPIPMDIEYAYNHSLHRLRQLDVRYVLLAHQGIVNVEDLAGGWDYVLDEVVRHMRKKKSSRLSQRLIGLAIGWSPEASMFSRNELCHAALPQSFPHPPAVTHFR